MKAHERESEIVAAGPDPTLAPKTKRGKQIQDHSPG
jgi:hypothetical protein